ncbi:MAG TPA: cytochrome P450 [Trebonia sp.]|nr:cytochrome P450 [Trebonia sp.]
MNSEHDAARAYDQWRAGGAVAFAEAFGGYHAVLSYDAVRACAADTARLVSGDGATIPVLRKDARSVPVEMDPPAHRKYRRLLQGPLRPERVAARAGRIAAVADQVIDEFIELGAGDLRRIAAVVPPAIIADILGTPGEAAAMVEMTDMLNRAVGSADPEVSRSAAAAFTRYIEGLVAEAALADGADGLLAAIVHGEVDGEPIARDTAVGMAVTLVVAGQETTVNGIGNLLWLLGREQGAKQRLLDDPALIPGAVDEALRLESPVQMMGRTAAADLEIDGVPVRKGDKVGLVFGAANLDPARFPDPGRFDLDRSPASHLAFGHGIHRCVGEHLARAEMQIVAERVLARIPDYRLAGEVALGANVAFNRGPRAIPVTFTPGRIRR